MAHQQETSSRAERRRHERFKATRGAYAAVSPNSFKIGQILNISRGGLLFEYVESDSPPDPVETAHLFLSSRGAYVSRIPFKTIMDRPVPAEAPGQETSLRQRSVAFGPLSLTQMTSLNHYIASNAC